jgi:hypothetical protein
MDTILRNLLEEAGLTVIIEILGVGFIGLIMLGLALYALRRGFVPLEWGKLGGILLVDRSAKLFGVTWGIGGLLVLLIMIHTHILNLDQVIELDLAAIGLAVGGLFLAWILEMIDENNNPMRRLEVRNLLDKEAVEDAKEEAARKERQDYERYWRSGGK